MTRPPSHIALIGFGEAGQAFARGWRREAPELEIRAFDIKTGGPDAAGKRTDYAGAQVTGCDGPEGLAGLPVVSLVTADQALAAARAQAAFLTPGTLYLDGNSCAPDTKRAAAEGIEAAGGRYVDMAIMAPVHPRLHRVPVLLAGPHAEAAQALCLSLGMSPGVAGHEIGQASAVKMLRSVMVKGIEALCLESLLAATKAGVADQVIASLDASHPGWDWAAKAAYNFERMTTHGTRRAAEMREVAATVAALGLDNGMSRATAAWAETVGSLGLPSTEYEFRTRAEALLAALEERKIQ
jgi:3-hydroxyisobutyrate dehydrogenase-like beta-hydroxyacid dehydrogenase